MIHCDDFHSLCVSSGTLWSLTSGSGAAVCECWVAGPQLGSSVPPTHAPGQAGPESPLRMPLGSDQHPVNEQLL